MPAYLLWKKTGTLRAWKLMTNFKRDEVISRQIPLLGYGQIQKEDRLLVVQDESVETGLEPKSGGSNDISNLDRTGYTRVLVRKDRPDGQAMGILV